MGFKVDLTGSNEFPVLAEGTYTAELTHWSSGKSSNGNFYVAPVFGPVVDGVTTKGKPYSKPVRVDPMELWYLPAVAGWKLTKLFSRLGISVPKELEHAESIEEVAEIMTTCVYGDFSVDVKHHEYNGSTYANITDFN